MVGGRSRTIDVLRGSALLGVLAVNLYFIAGEVPPATDADRAATWLREFFFTAKSYSLLALLFGLGFAIQQERARAAGRSFAPLFARRALVLLALGILHGILLWWGDILAIYALLGLCLFPFRAVAPRALLVWIVGLLGVATLAELGVAALVALAPGVPGTTAPTADLVRLYTTGGYLDITAARAGQWLTTAVGQLLLAFPNFFSMLLLGFWLGQRGVFADLERHRPLLRRFALLGLGFGLPANAVYATAATLTGPQWPGLYAAAALHTLGAPALMLGYLGTLVLLHQHGGVLARLLAPLAAAGRLSLSNYLLQSLIMNLLVYGYGLGLYGRVGAATGLGLALAVYLGQVALSSLYARVFAVGPAEKLWRALADA